MVNLILTLNSSPLPMPLCHVILQFVPIKIVKYISPLLGFGLGDTTSTNILEEIMYLSLDFKTRFYLFSCVSTIALRGISLENPANSRRRMRNFYGAASPNQHPSQEHPIPSTHKHRGKQTLIVCCNILGLLAMCYFHNNSQLR